MDTDQKGGERVSPNHHQGEGVVVKCGRHWVQQKMEWWWKRGDMLPVVGQLSDIGEDYGSRGRLWVVEEGR